ncbi:aconitate hydratase [Vallitalea pronyensis]|uniref:Aconitate hydratase n=1 Tax=Vallitalea pronyensis TaxID=1348613 RepID=A0A8J8MKF3_9FIRM|nr:aconitate hydratase [Vallitalea pronyensis]QUI22868.1 aconitate hydratase [Vallitalea pronyensis]
MGYNLTWKIIKEHLVEGDMIPGAEIGIRIDQTLTQDSTGTMAYLQLEAMEIDRVKTKKSVAYIDHNMLQQGFENADDHKYIQTVAHKHGVYFSRPGNGICHQVHLERFGVPGETLLGSDSHTPTGGGIGMLAIGAGGLDVAVAMGGGTYYITMPKVVNVKLTGKLRPFVTAKDIILEVLRVMSVKGGVGKVIEYTGEGVATLSVPERATITNMGAELGATTSVFQSDDVTKAFLEAQDRVDQWQPLQADEDAAYDESIEIDLSQLEPLVAQPHSPDNVEKVSNVKDLKVHQVCIGSCTNSSYLDMMKVAKILKGNVVHPDVSLVIAPGSKQVLNMLAANGALADMIAAGARILESGCGPCIGMGQAPATDAVTLRTFNRNFKGRCGTGSAGAYLLSPETAAVSALTGKLTNPMTCEADIDVVMPEKFFINDNMVVAPAEDGSQVEVVKGPNIKPFPLNEALQDHVAGKVLIVVEDNITTDHIMPSNAKLLPFRSNIPHLANFCLTPCDEDFPSRAKENKGGFILGGDNYGQGSSREHAALVPLYLGVKAVLTKSFARIHKANLVNSGILPLTFENSGDYDHISLDDELVMDHLLEQVKTGKVKVLNKTKDVTYDMSIDLSDKELKIILEGGKINFIKNA